jgi:CubicO group peptidase (beta-lactamase class C family)
MEAVANWQLGSTGHEVSDCCISARLRTYARIGVFILEGGRIKGRPQFPDTWLVEAARKQASTGAPGGNYGYQWWTRNDGSFNAIGISGQSILIDPRRQSGGGDAVQLAPGDRPACADAAVQAAVDAERPK